MRDNYQCRWCKVTDEKVVEWTIYRQEWRDMLNYRVGYKVADCAIYAHPNCYTKETSTIGNGQGVRMTGVTA